MQSYSLGIIVMEIHFDNKGKLEVGVKYVHEYYYVALIHDQSHITFCHTNTLSLFRQPTNSLTLSYIGMIW